MILFSKLLESARHGKSGAGCVFLSKDTGRLLLSYRSSEVNEPHTWGTWGGKIDDNETPEQTVRREIKEETGYTDKLRLVKLNKYTESNFEYNNYLAIVDKEFEPELNWESDAFKWVIFGQWPTPLHFGLESLISKSSNKIKQLIDTFPTVMKPDTGSELTVYRGVDPAYGDTNHGIQSIGRQNKLIGALGPNYTDNIEIAKRYGSEIKTTKINKNKVLELSAYEDTVKLYQKYSYLLPARSAYYIKHTEGRDQFRYIQQAAASLRKIFKTKYDAIKTPLGDGDKHYLDQLGLTGHLYIVLKDFNVR